MEGDTVLDSLEVVVLGDVNGDGRVTAVDARRTLRHLAKLENLTGMYAIAADVNFKDGITAVDARTILRVSAGLITMPKPSIDK